MNNKNIRYLAALDMTKTDKWFVPSVISNVLSVISNEREKSYIGARIGNLLSINEKANNQPTYHLTDLFRQFLPECMFFDPMFSGSKNI